MGLASILGGVARAKAPAARVKSVVLIFQTGAPSHLDTFDLKPEAPVEVRGSFSGTETKVPGIRFSEHLPMLAARADKLAIVRSMTHNVPSHEHGTHMMLAGVDRMPPGASHMASRSDWPCYASGLDFLRTREDGVPSGVMLPTYLNNGYGFCGQHRRRARPEVRPLAHQAKDPNAPDFRVDELSLPLWPHDAGKLADRPPAGAARRSRRPGGQALEKCGGDRRVLGTDSRRRRLHDAHLGQGRSRRSRSTAKEDPRRRATVTDGTCSASRSCWRGDWLIEAGVPIIQANMGHMNNWDTHIDNCNQLKDRLLPPLDRGVSAFLDDLETFGLLDSTLVVMVGEFGRTPKIGQSSTNDPNAKAGRDHWAGVFSAMFAGGGVRGGQVIGKSDKIGAYPATRGYYPSDLGATIYSALGIDPASEVTDRLGRPLALNRGEPIAPLFDGSLGA